MNRDEVISGLEKCAASECNEKCPYNGINYGCRPRLMLEAVELLKEQEDMTEFVIDDFQPTCKACGFHPFAGYIPTLEWIRERGFKFCPRCGRPVKWK